MIMKQSSFTNSRHRTRQRVSLLIVLTTFTVFGGIWAGGCSTNANTGPTNTATALSNSTSNGTNYTVPTTPSNSADNSAVSSLSDSSQTAAAKTQAEESQLQTLTQDKDYSKFTHTNAYHSRMPCLLCHRRDTNSPRISFPGKTGHTPCIGCHQLQFSDNSSPICTICHTNAQTGALKGFPGLQSFGRKFDHSGHKGVNCAVCHKPTARGVALSIPSGSTAHATCFQCHSASKPMAMSSCNVCHQLGRLVRTSQNARAYKISFSHSRHAQAGLNCASCHSVRAGGTGQQVTKPLTAMHFAPENKESCAACHNGQRAFGTNDFANCKRCHVGNSFKF